MYWLFAVLITVWVILFLCDFAKYLFIDNFYAALLLFFIFVRFFVVFTLNLMSPSLFFIVLHLFIYHNNHLFLSTSCAFLNLLLWYWVIFWLFFISCCRCRLFTTLPNYLSAFRIRLCVTWWQYGIYLLFNRKFALFRCFL